ncbi:MAG: UDP-N-acetylmuramoyl-L-alanyl-D-glutamate--2,6-diaminopimelate ligase, partial [Flammeovirgaceae bacterium]|nr:UDP-N-acetylmuramoyl-L-alanyl-D-glutamate--2,6-diaminopimelate ligase [Flammeovirgaceae bacterium]MDW8287205.1 UDP-N-acetylmuramoyl-L-alanyl-D-glutamate--2,6-diaminopimelate ligase [Flammeovirgaceae bacterium]
MISLADTLQFVPFRLVQGTLETPVAQLQLDSRKVSNGDAFVAIKGNEKDGHSFIPNAIEKGASVVICEDVPNEIPSHLTVVQLNETWRWLGRMASNFYGHPSTKMKVVAVTGTNGKTTTATLLYELFRKLGYHVGLFSTVVNKIDDKEIPTNLTTPDAITIHRLMAEMVAHGCTHVFMEASSHALVQGRLNDVRLEGGVFTNITHDHLDYHKTFDNYIRAKKLLFDGLDDQAFALVNADDKRATIMLQNCRAVKYTYALKSMADFHGKVVSSSFDGLQMRIGEREVWFRLIGEFNAYNLLCIYATAVLLEEDRENILKKMSLLQPARGRFEQIVA